MHSMWVHYVPPDHIKTACGFHVDDRFMRRSAKPAEVTCLICQFSDEYKAQQMEEALTPSSTTASFKAFTDELTEKVVQLCLSTSLPA